MSLRLFSLAIFLLLCSCSSADFRRLAPPGIIRYEKIAEEKEPNPVIEEEVARYRQDVDAKFPKVGETPAAAKGSIGRPPDITDDKTELTQARDDLEAAIATDEAAAAADRADTGNLDDAAEQLSAGIAGDKDADAREKAAVENSDSDTNQ